MSEQIKTTTIDQLPEAASLDGLYVFGYASKNAVGKRSVKAPITLLKGNKGDTGAAGKDGKDGEVTAAQLEEALRGINFLASEEANGLMSKEDKKQLNEIIESMKTDEEKYPTQIIFLCKNQEKVVNLGGVVSFNIRAGSATYKVKTKNYNVATETTSKTQYVGVITSSIEDVVEVFLDGNISSILLEDGAGNVSQVKLINRKEGITKLTIDNTKFEYIDLTGERFIKQISAVNSSLKSISVPSNEILEIVDLSGSKNMESCSLFVAGNTLTTLKAIRCTKLNRLFSGTLLTKLKYMYLDGTALTRAALMEIESKWATRIGQDTGVLSLSQSLYDTLTTEDRKKFIDKNITFDIVA